MVEAVTMMLPDTDMTDFLNMDYRLEGQVTTGRHRRQD
jgi:hypothetical protein